MSDTYADSSHLPLTLTLSDILSWRARKAPAGLAVIYQRQPLTGVSLTWRELEHMAQQFAAGLASRNVTCGSRVALVLKDSPECLATIFALWHLGAAVVPMDERWTTRMAEDIVSHSEPACVVGENAPSFQLGKISDFASFGELRRADAGASRSAAADCDTVAMITYTSGTTSNPKGVVLRHKHLRHAYRIARNSLFSIPPRRIGNVFRTAGLGVLGINYLFGMECGATVVNLTEIGIETARGFWTAVKQNCVDFIYLVPTAVQLITRLSEPIDDPRRVLCITGGAPIPERTHATFQERFHHPLRNVYGLTEATCGFLWGAEAADGHAAWHLGRPPAGIQIRLRDSHGNSDDSVTTGELEVSGPILSDGYWLNPEATHEVFVDGWLRTGDIAQRDAEGNYTITGRMKNVVIRGGFNIYLEEVDQTLLAHPDVLSACTVGLQAANQEEALAALVQLRAGALTTSEELANWCRSRIGASKTPGMIVLAQHDLPRNSSGKINRAEVLQAIRNPSPIDPSHYILKPD